ncbi:hypothetical protein PRIPAC_86940, partial [Pristionchus pacificus]
FLPVDRSPTMYSHGAAIAANSATEDRPNTRVTSCEINTWNKKRRSSCSGTDEMPHSVPVENLSTQKSEHVSNSPTVTASYHSPNFKIDMNSPEFLYSIHLPPPPIPPQIIVLDGPSPTQVRAPSPQFGWSRHYSSNGSPYFYNATTGASTFKRPNGWSESGASPIFSPQPNTMTPAKAAPLQCSISTPPNAYFPEIFNSPVDMEISPRDDPQQNERVEMRILNAPPPKRMTTLIDVAHKYGISVEALERNLINRSILPVHEDSNLSRLNQPDHQTFDREINKMMRLSRMQAREATHRSIESDLQAAVSKTEQTIRQLQLPTDVRRKAVKSKEERENYVSLIYEISLKNVNEKENHINE